ncbi:hypothetical protein B0H19DRAFT_1141882 [Mycena capillaripes]|nr:hypothetical protein B0H19DRAFT_1141882 [Mycena capillaripes]
MTVFWIALFAAPLLFKINSGTTAHAWSLHLRTESDSDDSGSACNAICAPVGDAAFQSATGKNDTYCTDSFVLQYAQCRDCGDQLDPDEAQDSQAEIDTFVEDCTADGHGVHGVTIAGSFKGSAGPAGGGSTASQSPASPSPTASNPAVSGQGNTKSNGGCGSVRTMGEQTILFGICAGVLLGLLSGC